MKNAFSRFTILAVSVLLVLSGCSGKNGGSGQQGPTGATGPSMPVIQSLTVSGVPSKPGGSASATASAQSGEGLSLSYAWTVSGGWAIASGATTSTATFTAPASYGAGGTATVTVTDAQGKTATGAIALSTEGNSAPIIHTISTSVNPVNKGGSTEITVTATDPNGDEPEYSWTAPAGYTIESGQGTAAISAKSILFTSGSFEVTVTDGSGEATKGSVYVSTKDGTWDAAMLAQTNSGAYVGAHQIASRPSGTVEFFSVYLKFDGVANSVYARRFDGSAWGPDVLIEIADGEASSPQIGMDEGGNAVAVWLQFDGTYMSVYANRYDAASGQWGSARLLETGAYDASSPGIALDTNSSAIAVWAQSDSTDTYGNIYASRYSGGAWGTPVVINSGAAYAAYPGIASDGNGNAMAVWRQLDVSAYQIYANRYDGTAGAWGTAVVIGQGNSGSSPQVAVDSSGNAVALWIGASNSIYVNLYSGGAWGTASYRGTGYSARIAMGPGGVAFAVWRGSDGSVYAARYAGALAPAQVIESSAQYASDPWIGVDSSGNAIAVWKESSSGSGEIHANRYAASSGLWGTAGLIETDAGFAESPRIAVHQGGAAVAAWEFSTRTSIYANQYSGGNWLTSPKVIAISSGYGYDPEAVVSAAGNVLAVWNQSDGVAGRIYANQYSSLTREWADVAAIDAATGNASGSSVSMDSGGNAVVVWYEDIGGNYNFNIYANRYNASTRAWSGPELLETSGYASSPRVAVNSGGDAVAVWVQFDGTYDNIYANRYDASAGTWSGPELLETNNGSIAGASYGYPRVAINSSGDAVVVWSQNDGTDDSIYANRYDASTGAWGSAQLIETNPEDGYNPEVAIDSSGNCIAVWGHEEDGYYYTYSIYANRYDALTGAWGAAQLIETKAGYAEYPQIAMDPAGNAVAVWHQDVNGTINQIYANRYDATAGTWGAAQMLGSNIAWAQDPRIAMDQAGNAIVVWWQWDGAYNSIYSRRYIAGSGWGATTLVETNTGNSGYPYISMDQTGNAAVVWSQSDGSAATIRANVFR